MPPIASEGAEKKAQSEVGAWEQQVQEDALREAGSKEGPLHMRSIEAQLRQLSDQVTREAQERRERSAQSQ
ncbi:MAG TPA: hypothetical protein VGN34_24995 [Ktedonobacteraceae bacterium]